MTKRHYEQFARMIAEIAETPGIDFPTLQIVTSKLADVCQRDNPRFNRDRFFAATVLYRVKVADEKAVNQA